MLEIIIPDYREKFFVKPNEKMTVKMLKSMIAGRIGSADISGMYVIDVENMNVLDEKLCLKDAVESCNSRLLLV